MQDLSIEVGRVVHSKAGRDKGRFFVINGIIDETYVYVVDGELRKLAKPKKKKVKHLELKPEVLTGIKEKIETGKKVFDAEIKKAIKNTRYFDGEKIGGGE